MKFLVILLFPIVILAQPALNEDNLNKAFLNAKKGFYWALSNIPEKKKQAGNDLIDNDKRICSVNLEKGINGVKIESTGFFESCEVKITTYKSMDSLIKEGFIKIDSTAIGSENTTKTSKRKKK